MKTFWNHIEDTYFNVIREAKLKNEVFPKD